MPIKFDVRNRWTGAVQFTAEIDCAEDAPPSLKLGLAVKWAIKSDSNLSGSILRDSDLRDSDLSGSILSELQKAQLSIVPEEGAYTAWKKCAGGIIVKLLIPAEAKRSNATGRKCRAEFADVLEIFGAEVAISAHDQKTEYRVGQRVTCDQWEADRWVECAGGIHHFLTRAEAEAY